MITLTEINQYFYEKDSELYWKVQTSSRSLKDNIAGSITKVGYRQVSFNHKSILVHRILYQIYNNLEILTKNYFIDHVDGNRSNNSKDNLRLATNAQNQHNAKKCSRNTSGIKGISIVNTKCYTYYVCSIQFNRKTKTKSFTYTPEGLELAKAWLEITRKELHGEFARNE